MSTETKKAAPAPKAMAPAAENAAETTPEVENNTAKEEVAEKVAPKVVVAKELSKGVKVKFIVAHKMNISGERIDASIGDVFTVEGHIANLLIERRLAHLTN